MRYRGKQTRYEPESLRTPGRVRVFARLSPCGCGCNGEDPWHRPTFVRSVRRVEVLDEPEVLTEGLSTVVARGVAKFPWGEEPVIAVNYRGSRYVDWEREGLR